MVEHDSLLFASGWHINANDFTTQLVDVAVNTFRAGGLQATLDHFASPESSLAGLASAIAYYNQAETVDGQWSVFIASESGRLVAHSNPDLIGTGVEELLGTEIFNAPESGTWITTASLQEPAW